MSTTSTITGTQLVRTLSVTTWIVAANGLTGIGGAAYPAMGGGNGIAIVGTDPMCTIGSTANPTGYGPGAIPGGIG